MIVLFTRAELKWCVNFYETNWFTREGTATSGGNSLDSAQL